MHAFRSYIFAARIACDSGPTCYLSRGLRYPVEIWHANRFPPSYTDAVTKPEVGSRFPTLWPPSLKIDITS